MTETEPLSLKITKDGKEFVFTESNITEMFHHIYYLKQRQTWENTFFLGKPILKCPLDLWVYQEIFVDVKPDIVIETGTYYGASAVYLALTLEFLGNGNVISIDINPMEKLPQFHRLKYLVGSSVSEEIVSQVEKLIEGKKTVLVILDSDHSKDHVKKEMDIYSKLVSVGSYMIVEDSNINGHPVKPGCGPGPFEAIEEFLTTNDKFVIDKSREKIHDDTES